jgi:hypothetical protein
MKYKDGPSPGAFACNVTLKTRTLQNWRRRTERYNALMIQLVTSLWKQLDQNARKFN